MPRDPSYLFLFKKPTESSTGGSFPLAGMTDPQPRVAMNAVQPKSQIYLKPFFAHQFSLVFV